MQWIKQSSVKGVGESVYWIWLPNHIKWESHNLFKALRKCLYTINWVFLCSMKMISCTLVFFSEYIRTVHENGSAPLTFATQISEHGLDLICTLYIAE
jgi:hypothetical protein